MRPRRIHEGPCDVQIIYVITHHPRHGAVFHVNLNCAMESCIKSFRQPIALWARSQEFYIFKPLHFDRKSTLVCPRESVKEIQVKRSHSDPRFTQGTGTRCHAASQSLNHKSLPYHERFALERDSLPCTFQQTFPLTSKAHLGMC